MKAYTKARLVHPMEARRKILNIYNILPFNIKGKVSLIGKILPPRIIFGQNYIKTIEFLKQTEFLPKNEINLIRNKSLRKILLHAYDSTKFYRNMCNQKNISRDYICKYPEHAIKHFDFIDKTIVRENSQNILSNHRNKMKYDYVSTGGTSGEPFYFYINSDRSSKEWAFITDQWSRIGFKPGSRRISFRGSKISNNGWEDDHITAERKFSSFQMTDSYLEKVWPLINDYNASFLYAYPSTALALCQFMHKTGKKFPDHLKGILLGSENIYSDQRQYIEKISGKKTFIWYGHSEKLILAGECEHQNYYHDYPQYGYTEFINDKGENAKPGEFCEIVGTGFFNTVMPFIRYRTGDYCTYLGDSCRYCGRNYHIFEDIKGRWIQEVLYGKLRNPICMSAINLHSNSMRNIFRFQFYQERYGEAILKIVPRNGFRSEESHIIEKEFNEKFAGALTVKAQIVNDIPLTRIGKFKFIEQKL